MRKLNLNHSLIMIFLIQILSKFVALILLFFTKKKRFTKSKKCRLIKIQFFICH